jgi:hypothetical protein
MAGEKTAKFYESLSAIAVREAIKGSSWASLQVYREVKLPGVSIRNDVVIGESREKPSFVFLVTHCKIEVHWAEKFKRDSAELIELLVNDLDLKGVYLILFDDRILPRHLKIAAMSLSGIVQASKFDKDGSLRGLAQDTRTLARLDKMDESQRQSELKKMFSSTAKRRALLRGLINEIKETMSADVSGDLNAGGYISLTKANIAKREKDYTLRHTRHTRFNRGVSKLGLFCSSDRDRISRGELLSGPLDWATFDIFWPINNKTKGQLVTSEGKNRYRCKDPEILGGPLGAKKTPIVVESVFDCLSIDDIGRIIARGRQPMAEKYEARIQAKKVFESSIQFIRENYVSLTKGTNLGNLLIEISADPAGSLEQHCGKVKSGVDVQWNWLYTGLVSLFKSAKKSKQGYGTSKIAERIRSEKHRSAVGNTVLKNLESCLKTLDADLVIATGVSMAGFLRDLSTKEIERAIADSYKYFLMCEVEDKYIPHAIDVLPAMIELAAEREGVDLAKTHLTSCLAVASDAGGTAGRTNVYRSKNSIIWYKASHLRQNVLHKRKELQSTVASWWQTWDPIKESFIPTKDFKKTILVIDGDWEEEDLKLMHAFGWDEFLYPDELDRLPDLIV